MPTLSVNKNHSLFSTAFSCHVGCGRTRNGRTKQRRDERSNELESNQGHQEKKSNPIDLHIATNAFLLLCVLRLTRHVHTIRPRHLAVDCIEHYLKYSK